MELPYQLLVHLPSIGVAGTLPVQQPHVCPCCCPVHAMHHCKPPLSCHGPHLAHRRQHAAACTQQGGAGRTGITHGAICWLVSFCQQLYPIVLPEQAFAYSKLINMHMFLPDLLLVVGRDCSPSKSWQCLAARLDTPFGKPWPSAHRARLQPAGIYAYHCIPS